MKYIDITALHVRAMTTDAFVFPGSDTVQETSSNNWLRKTSSRINFSSSSFGGNQLIFDCLISILRAGIY